MKLLIDIGNTSAKLAISDNGDFIHFERLSELWEDAFSRLNRDFNIDEVAISSVAGPDSNLDDALSRMPWTIKRIQWDTPCPVKDISGIPEGYGADRIAADFGAFAQDNKSTILVIDAGTCITYDLFSSDGKILGGVISPGVQLRLQAMHDHTALLPLFKAEPDAPLYGMNTKECLLAGAIYGAKFEVLGYIRELSQQYPDLHVFLTGGNNFHVPEDITCKITHDPYLVLKGLDLL